MFKSIHSKILSAQLFLVCLATFSLGIASFFIITSYLENTEKEKSAYIARTWAEKIEDLIADRKNHISLISQSKEVESYSSSSSIEPLKRYLRTFTDTLPTIIYLNEKGFEEIKLVSGEAVSGDKNESANIKKALANPNTPLFQVVTPKPSAKGKVFSPYFEFTFYNQLFGEFAGIITAQIPIVDEYPDFAAFSSFRFEKSGFLTLYDSEGTTISHHNPEQILTKIKLPPGLQGPFSTQNPILFQRDSLHGIEGFTTYAPVSGTNLLVAATLPYDQFKAVPNKMRNLFLIVITTVVLIGIILSATIARSISSPILNLANAAQNLAKGKWDQQVQINSQDEIGILGRSFKKMSDDLHKMITTRDNEIVLRKRVEQAMKRSHLELDQIFNTAAGGMVVINRSHEIVRVNDTFLQMLNLNRHNVIGRHCHDVFPDKTCGTDTCIMDEVLKKNGKIEKEAEKTRTDGRTIICNIVATPFHDMDGTLIGIIEDFRDITITKKTEELVKFSEKRYRRLFNSAPDGISVLNNQGVIIDCNQSLASIYKRPRTKIIGRHFTHFNTPESKENCIFNFDRIQKTDQVEGEVKIETPNGTIITLWRKGTTIKSARGAFNGVLIYDRDISKQKEIEGLKEDMSRISRHDLKTPLNGIINLPLLIKRENNLSEQQIKRLELIESAGYNMLKMLNSSLDLYKMEEGTYLYTPVAVNLCSVLNKIKEELWADMQANQSNIEIFLDGTPVGDNYFFQVQGEELLCYSMLANLIRNAVESSPRAATISIYLDSKTQPNVQIHNHGQVPAAIHDQFFHKYVTEGKKQGSGLGTYSAKLMAQTMDGDISMSSSQSTGTTIKINMPWPSGNIESHETLQENNKGETEKRTSIRADKISQSNRPKNKKGDATRARHIRHILLAEDDPINQALATALLEDKGFVVSLAANGREALELYKKSSFDLILMDMQMPLLNGIETTRVIRKTEEKTGRRIPIIAVTGMNNEKNSKVFFQAGVDALIPKPIQIDLLWEAIEKYIDG